MQSILGILRHVLTTLGCGLVTNGTLSGGDLETGVGALLTVAGIAWSIYDKKRQSK